ncbi:Tetratricopeptide repeat protein 12 [Acropora cervicornis]|uniref:Tetratricopeptide repeat protein 12 n=1 Tax=Acropora cervicornis TaxID=6130 RepID=A0AAD9QSI1_ACRCE|nr:Tetratricopeptide repeat protein 12 [Acropora cervicornis]
MEETSDKEEEFKKFLGKVDEIDAIMKDLTCDDLERQNKAQSAADEFLKRHRTENALDSDEDGGQFKTNFNRTVISKGRKEGKLHPSSSTLDQIERRLREAGEVCAAEKLKGKGNDAFNKGQYTEAIGHYNMAITKFSSNPVLYTNRAQIDPKCVKAFVHKAKALQAQGKFDEAITVLKSPIEVAPKQEKILKGYIAEAESAKQRLQEEKESSLATSQYLDATRRLLVLLDNNTNKTIFRCYGGFQIIELNKKIRGYWEDYNVDEFLKKDHTPCFNHLLRDPTSPVIRTSVASFLHQLSQTEKGRLGLTACKDVKWVTEALFLLVQRGTNTAVVAIFCEKIRDLVDKDFLSISQKFVLRLCEENSTASREPTDNWSLVSSGLSALANMARDTYIRNRIADDQQWWETAIKFLDAGPKLVAPLIGLLNVGYDEICERSLASLRHLLNHSTEALNQACDQKIFIHVMQILKVAVASTHFPVCWGASTRETVKRYSIKILTLCTMERKEAREAVVKEKEEVTNHLAKVNGVVEILLKHATNDKLSNDVKQNAAICLAKLATSDERLLVIIM